MDIQPPETARHGPDLSLNGHEAANVGSGYEQQRQKRTIARSPNELDRQECSSQSNGSIARCFLGLANADGAAFDRLGRYETTLWRQVGQIMFVLGALQGRDAWRMHSLS